jgi:hypothetical protein
VISGVPKLFFDAKFLVRARGLCAILRAYPLWIDTDRREVMKKLKLVAALMAVGFAVGVVQARVERLDQPINPSSEKKAEKSKAPETPKKVEKL